MFKSRTPEIEKSVKDHDDQVAFAVKEYLKENKLDYNESDVDKIADVQTTAVSYYQDVPVEAIKILEAEVID